MNNRILTLLVLLFFGGLLGLWYGEYRKVPTSAEAVRLRSRVLPALLEIEPLAIHRVEIDGPKRLVFARGEAGRWRIVEPIEARASAPKLETLIQNLKGLPRPADASSVPGKPAKFGLQPPERTIRLYGSDSKQPLATLAIGKEVRGRRYVQPEGGGIDLVDAKMLAPLGETVADWREPSLFDLTSLDVDSVEVAGGKNDFKAERTEHGWRLERPVRAPGDPSKISNLVDQLARLRVAGGADGYVADHATDLGRFGLDKPRWVVRLTTPKTHDQPQNVDIGARVPDTSRYYAHRVGRDEVVTIDGKALDGLDDDPRNYRSPRVTDIDPSKVDYLRVLVGKNRHELSRHRDGWHVLNLTPGKADDPLIVNLLNELAMLQTGPLLEPAEVPRSGLDEPSMVIDAWQSGGAEGKPEGRPVLSIRFGRRDRIKRLFYARSEGDPSILTLPDKALEQPLAGPFAFHDRTITHLNPGSTLRIKVARDGQTFKLEAPENPRDYAHWKLTEPIKAAADRESVARLDRVLSNLRAVKFVDLVKDHEKKYGLDAPAIDATWTTRAGAESASETAHRLRIGGLVPRGGGSRFAAALNAPWTFTVGPEVVQAFEAEFRDRRIFQFAPDRVDRVVLRWPARTLPLARRVRPLGTVPEWLPELGISLKGFDTTQLNPLIAILSTLQTPRFSQYDGPIPAATGLRSPRLAIEIEQRGDPNLIRLRIGDRADAGHRFATNTDGRSGLVFLLPDSPREPWSALLKEGDELPANVFAP